MAKYIASLSAADNGVCARHGGTYYVRGDARHGVLCRMSSAGDKEVAQNLACERCSNGCKCDVQCDCGPTCTCARYVEQPCPFSSDRYNGIFFAKIL